MHCWNIYTAYRTRGSFTSNQLEQRGRASRATFLPLCCTVTAHAVQMDGNFVLYLFIFAPMCWTFASVYLQAAGWFKDEEMERQTYLFLLEFAVSSYLSFSLTLCTRWLSVFLVASSFFLLFSVLLDHCAGLFSRTTCSLHLSHLSSTSILSISLSQY